MKSAIGLQFDESMSGFLCQGETEHKELKIKGERSGTSVQFDVQIHILDMKEFVNISHQQATLSGSIRSPLWGDEKREIHNGIFNVFTLDRDTAIRKLVYKFAFTNPQGEPFFLSGEKEIKDDPGIDILDDMTTLFTTIYRGIDDSGEVFGTGILYFKIQTVSQMLSSAKVTGDATFLDKGATILSFISFVYGNIRDEYLQKFRPVYDTRYQNLVLSGHLNDETGTHPFFMVSGVHDKGFPWGDGETFWDVLLAILNPDGSFERYAITDRTLNLVLDIEKGTYRYNGPIFSLDDTGVSGFSQMRANLCCALTADIEIDFSATHHTTVPFPFPQLGAHIRAMETKLQKEFRKIFNSESELGVHITPYSVTINTGTLAIEGNKTKKWTVQPKSTVGEAEAGRFRNIIEPTLLYGYICAVLPEERTARVQIHTRTMRNEKEHWGKDQLDALVGALFSHIGSAEILLERGTQKITRLKRRKTNRCDTTLFQKQGPPIIEINNDHYPTAVFQRRIIRVKDPGGKICFALEEDMSSLRLEAIESTEKTIVAAIRHLDKYRALETALVQSGFANTVTAQWQRSGKTKQEFAVVIKPNFMFAYNVADRSTYTDPALVGRLVQILKNDGFTNISVVETQSTYGQYFTNRSVREVAEYLGFDKTEGYQIVDMTNDAFHSEHLGTQLGIHPVSKTWKEADFRISFAKNKTHAYAYYTLNLKNIYGALPPADKFQEYHCNRGIYDTAIEYLKAFPVHFALVDAYLSADGPFGIFADADPNLTQTIIAGKNLIAVDWVGATKMGLDPKISRYMTTAIKTFGKPAIKLVGDSSFYSPWLNVPMAITQFTGKGLDANYIFGNLIYKICAEMDPKQFKHKSNSLFIRRLRKLTNPIRKTVFVQIDEPPSFSKKLLYKILYKLGY